MRPLSLLSGLLILSFSLPPTVSAVDPMPSSVIDEQSKEDGLRERFRTEAEAIAEDLDKAAQAFGWSSEQASAYVVAEAEMNRIGKRLARSGRTSSCVRNYFGFSAMGSAR